MNISSFDQQRNVSRGQGRQSVKEKQGTRANSPQVNAASLGHCKLPASIFMGEQVREKQQREGSDKICFLPVSEQRNAALDL